MAGFLLALYTFSLAAVAQTCTPTGTFYIPDYVTGGSANVSNQTYTFYAGNKVDSGYGGAIGLYFDDNITFTLGTVCPNSVLELTRGGGYGSDNMDVDFKMTVYDGDSPGVVLHEHIHLGDGYTMEGSGRVFIPLDGADTSSITIHVERFENSAGDDAEVPAAYLGSIAGVWVVGEVHEDEQVMVVDLDPFVYGSCEFTNASQGDDSGETYIRNAHYFRSESTCWINLNFTHIVSGLQSPVVMEFNGFREPNEADDNQVVEVYAPGQYTDDVFSQFADYDSYETGYFAFQIPGDYLLTPGARVNETQNLSAWEGGKDDMPFTRMFGNWFGSLDKYAKFQGSGLKAQVIDLSGGDFSVAGDAVKDRGNDMDDDNMGLSFNESTGLVLPWSNGGGSFNFTLNFIAPFREEPFFLEVLHARLDSDDPLTFSLSDAVTGQEIATGLMKEYEDDKGENVKSFFYTDGLTSGQMNISWVVDSDSDGIYFSPWLVARWLVAATTTTTVTTSTQTTSTKTATATGTGTTTTVTTSTVTTSTVTTSTATTSTVTTSTVTSATLTVTATSITETTTSTSMKTVPIGSSANDVPAHRLSCAMFGLTAARLLI